MGTHIGDQDGIEAHRCPLDHHRAPVNADHRPPGTPEERAHQARSASDVGDRAAHGIGEPAEELPVERLCIEFVEELGHVGVRHLVVRRR